MTGTCIKQGSAYQPSSTMYLLPATNHLKDSGEKWSKKKKPRPSTHAHPQFRLHFIIPKSVKPVLAGKDPACTSSQWPVPEPLLFLALRLRAFPSCWHRHPWGERHILPRWCTDPLHREQQQQPRQMPTLNSSYRQPRHLGCVAWEADQKARPGSHRAGFSLAPHLQLTLTAWNLKKGYATPHHTAQIALHVVPIALFIT